MGMGMGDGAGPFSGQKQNRLKIMSGPASWECILEAGLRLSSLYCNLAVI